LQLDSKLRLASIARRLPCALQNFQAEIKHSKEGMLLIPLNITSQYVLFNLKIANDENFARIQKIIYGHDDISMQGYKCYNSSSSSSSSSSSNAKCHTKPMVLKIGSCLLSQVFSERSFFMSYENRRTLVKHVS
jgi:hypothetical protein